MVRRALVVVAVALLSCVAAPACAVDYPVAGTQLTLRDSASGEGTLLLVLRDASLPLAQPGSPDDPSQAGLSVTIFARGSGAHAQLAALPGIGRNAWRVHVGPRGVAYGYRNGSARRFAGEIGTAGLRSGSGLKVRARSAGVALGSPLGAVAVRVAWGSVRVCALFDGVAVRRDGAGLFLSRDADAAGLADCEDDTLAGRRHDQRRFCGVGPVTAACSLLLTSRSACEQEGGCWDRSLFHPDGNCNCPTLDGGSVCRGTDCEGLCVATEGTCASPQVGECSDTQNIYGCICVAFPSDFNEFCFD